MCDDVEKGMRTLRAADNPDFHHLQALRASRLDGSRNQGQGDRRRDGSYLSAQTSPARIAYIYFQFYMPHPSGGPHTFPIWDIYYYCAQTGLSADPVPL